MSAELFPMTLAATTRRQSTADWAYEAGRFDRYMRSEAQLKTVCWQLPVDCCPIDVFKCQSTVTSRPLIFDCGRLATSCRCKSSAGSLSFVDCRRYMPLITPRGEGDAELLHCELAAQCVTEATAFGALPDMREVSKPQELPGRNVVFTV